MRFALGLGLALALAPAAHAAPSPPLREFPHQHGNEGAAWPASDGLRYVVVNAAPGVVRVYDAERRRAHDVTVRPQCDMRDVTVNFALIGCDDDPRPFFLRLRTRTISPRGDFRRDGLQWHAIGRYGLQGSYHENRPVVMYTNWRTGEGGGSFDGFEEPPHDLDSPDLAPYSPNHTTFARRGPYLMKDIWKDPRQRDKQLVLDHASRRRTVLSECEHPCGRGDFSAGLASWPEFTSHRRTYLVRTHDIRARRRFAWRFAGQRHQPHVTGHTRRHVLVTVADDKPPHRPRLLWARARR